LRKASEERRRPRRESRAVSLDRWLSSVASQTGAEELVLTDGRGVLVAGSSSSPAAARIAALGCGLVAPGSAEVAVLRLYTRERDLRLCAAGELVCRIESVLLAEPGVSRILAEKPSAA
jgi:hypothetical protein